ncbi:Ig-like domain repeat protein, partial [Methanobrevibacter smithii]|uniref:Ig-like domain repeat protein n=1 Tax=Methanobrevibacter smithii TaxID=2173 RepID=UPI00384C4803
KLIILNIKIVNNTVGMTFTGYGQYLIYGSSANANINIENSVISNNTAENALESEIFQLTNGNTLNVTYSSIVDNKFNKIFNVKSGNAAVTLDYNWWGNNSVSDDKISKWIIMTTPENITAEKGKTIDVEVYFNHYTDTNGKIYDLDINVPITVKFSAVNGTLLNNVADSVNGIASVSYTVNNNDTITVKSGNQTATINIISKVIDAIWVSAEGNDANDGSENSPVATIAKAIELAKNSSTIYIMEGSYSQGQITINKEVSITGLGKVILTNNAFICKADNVEFNNIIFSQNNGSSVLKVYGNNIKIYNCTFSSVNTDLGVLYLSSGSVDIVNTVINNVNSRYLISISKNTILKMSNSIVDENNLENSIFYLGDGSSLNADYCIITNNRFADYVSIEEGGESVISLDYNWWGTNTPAGKDIKNWVIMNAPESISGEKGETVTVDVDFNHYMNVDGKIHTLTKHIPETTIYFDGNILNTVDGLATFSYTVGNSNKIVVKSANQSSVIDVIIKEVKRDIWVSAEGNDENNGSQDSPVATIKKALELVSDGSSIYIAPGTYLEDGLEITKSVNIIGSGKVIIDANNGGKIISTTNKSAVINLANLELTKAKSNFGCVIYNLGANFTLNNISIYDNEITDALANTMSAIYNTGVMAIKNSKIIHNMGHGLIYNSNNLVLINSTVSGNDISSGTSSYGIVYSTSGVVKIFNSNITNNIARLGTVYISNGDLIVENSIFEANNVILGNGGAITLFSLSSKSNITNATFRDNAAARDGGAILARGDVNILNSIFENNAAGNGYYGNAIYNYGNLNIHYSVLLENASSNYVIYNYGYNPSANAQYNWWGTNDDPSRLVGAGQWDEYTLCEDVDVSNWIVMGVIPDIIENITGNQLIKVSFDKYQGKDGKLFDLTRTLPEFNVKFSAINGTLSDNLAKVINNAASVNYTISDNDTITVESGDEIFNIKVIVAKETSIILINVDDIVVGENATIDVFVNKNATGSVIIGVNNKNTTVNIKDGKASLIVSDLTAGKYDVVVKYSGDINYGTSKNITSFNVGKIAKYDVDVDVSKVQSGENATITVILPKDATGNVTIIVANKKYNATVVNGTAKIITDVLDDGTYDVVVYYSGDDKYLNSVKQLNMTVDINKNVNLKADDIVMFYKDGTRFIAVLTDYKGNPIANETLIFVINGVKYTKITDNNGTASIALNLMPGVYEGLVLFNGTLNYNNISVKCNITIKSTVIGCDIVKMFRNATQYSALFLDSNGNPLVNAAVKFNINGVFYTKITNSEGIATLNIKLLPAEYIITNYNLVTGEENSNKVTVKSLLVDNSDLVKYYLNESKYTLKVIGKDGKVAAGQEVSFNINGVFYHRVSDENGIVSLSIKLRPGDYIVTAEYEGCRVSNNVKVLPTLVTKDLVMKYMDGSSFTAQTLDGQGKVLANQKISFNINGVFYHRTTDENGMASLHIRLNPGKYIITSIWNEYQIGNNITIA